MNFQLHIGRSLPRLARSTFALLERGMYAAYRGDLEDLITHVLYVRIAARSDRLALVDEQSHASRSEIGHIRRGCLAGRRGYGRTEVGHRVEVQNRDQM